MAAKMTLSTAAIAQGITSNQLLIDAAEHDVRTQPVVWGWDGRPVVWGWDGRQATRGEEEDTDTIFYLAAGQGHGRCGISTVNCYPARVFRGGWTFPPEFFEVGGAILITSAGPWVGCNFLKVEYIPPG